MTKCVRTKAGKTALTPVFLRDAGLDPALALMTRKDVDALLALEAACFLPPQYEVTLTRAKAMHYAGGANGIILIYHRDNRVAGYGQLSFRADQAYAKFDSLAVHPDFQGKGVGNGLFQGIEQIARAVGAPDVLLEIREDNHVLKARYEKLGYAVYKTVPDYYGDQAAALKMRKP